MNKEDQAQDIKPVTPKSSLENLSQGELIKKYKILLTISQKAKQAKDDAVEESNQIKKELNTQVQQCDHLKLENEQMKLRVIALQDERESILSAIENVKSNNSQLQEIVRGINTERDLLFKDVQDLNVDKQKLVQIVDMMGQENDTLLVDNQSLKVAKQKINEQLTSANCELEIFFSEMKDVQVGLDSLLNISFTHLESLDIDSGKVEYSDIKSTKKYTNDVCDLITKLDINLSRAASDSRSRKSNEAEETLQLEKSADYYYEVHTRLVSEMDQLNKLLTNLETWAEITNDENQNLKDKWDVYKNETSQHEEELMKTLETTRHLCSQRAIDNQLLKDEIAWLMEKNKEQSFNAMEMQGLKLEMVQKEAESETLNVRVASLESELIKVKNYIIDLEKKSEILEKDLLVSQVEKTDTGEMENKHLKIKSELTILQENYEMEKKQYQIIEDKCKRLETKLLKLSQEKINSEDDSIREKALLTEEKHAIAEVNQAGDTELAKCEASGPAALQEFHAEWQQSIANKDMEFIEQIVKTNKHYNTVIENVPDKLIDVDITSGEAESILSHVRSENKQLLVEMNEMNQVLKQRGETISKVRELNKELELKLQENDNKLQAFVHESAARSKELEAKEKLVVTLSDDVSRLNTRVLQLEKEIKDQGDTCSEAMSCSTLSRADENNRLHDIENSFEDRYTKLRAVAVKLKKRNFDLTAQLGLIESERNKLSDDLQAKCQQLSSNAKNVQLIQQEYDKMQDQLDMKSNEIKTIQQLLDASVQNLTTVKICLEQTKEEKNTLIKEANMYVEKIHDLESKIKCLNTSVLSGQEASTEVVRLNEELKINNEKFQEMESRHNEILAQLKAKNDESKKNNVLCLEINNYEKSMSDLSKQVATEKMNVSELNSRVENQQEIIDGLYQQIKLMEESFTAETSRSDDVNEQLHILRSRLSEASLQSEQQIAEIQSVKLKAEAHRVESEKAALELSQFAAEQRKVDETQRQQIDTLNKQVLHLEEELQSTGIQLNERTRELNGISAEFENYKRRAQSVLLKQKHKPEVTDDKDCIDEIGQLRNAAIASKTLLEKTNTKLEAANVERISLQEDRDRILKKCQELSEKLSSLQSKNLQLSNKHQELTMEHREAFKTQKIHHDNAIENYQRQLVEMEGCLTGDNQILRDQLTILESKLKNHLHHEDNAKSWNPSRATFTPVVQSQDYNVMMQEREDAEGSESVDSASPHLGSAHEQRRPLVSLETLLASSNHEDNVSATDLSKPRDKPSASERQVQHLAALLSEAEQDLARLTQLNDVLKEEIRRNERSDEREKHAHNQEYLKNVFLKFLTLQCGDERARLVPVLNTILKLSPQETSHLSAVANNKDYRAGGGKGWGSYLWQ